MYCLAISYISVIPCLFVGPGLQKWILKNLDCYRVYFFYKKAKNLKSPKFRILRKNFKIHISDLQSQQKIVAFQSN